MLLLVFIFMLFLVHEIKESSISSFYCRLLFVYLKVFQLLYIYLKHCEFCRLIKQVYIILQPMLYQLNLLKSNTELVCEERRSV